MAVARAIMERFEPKSRVAATAMQDRQMQLQLFQGEARPLRVPDKPSLRPDEVAQLLGCSDEHVRHLIEEGSLAAVDVRCAGTSRPAHRIVQASVVEFVQQRKTV